MDSALIKLKKELNQSIIGRQKEIDFMLMGLLVQGHVLLESVPGSGKTMMAKSFAEAIQGEFKRIQFTPDVLPSDVTGISYFHPQKQEFILRMGPVMSNILLADEINRATPRTQSSLLEAMEEKQVSIDGETIKLPYPFMVIATQNPIESQQGTFQLPAAQLDRFLFKLNIGYPTMKEENYILKHFGQAPGKVKTKQVVTLEKIEEWSKQVNNIQVHEDIFTYIIQIVQGTRKHQYIELGLSSRASLAMLQASKAHAFINGREYVTPDDVKNIIDPVCLHRLRLSSQGMLIHEISNIMAELIKEIEAPVEASI
ncbi:MULTISPECIES: MoxR family ATPase [unclassified Psychrobacillus]|uniref:AAA family ATPase n=1 Tax=unclassified Psychrobacillus TaxID=2636677 RepID=UPI00146A1570|nr:MULTISPECIES: MoxR family ATPase [unclassified Psychrobacillus]MCM3358982.1 MoxR family ATPase [Psychrobacillus sp. MER TA 171]NME05141.1 MoxR family ATPase [Psychrobacillus sp. BL-248-WT-3]